MCVRRQIVLVSSHFCLKEGTVCAIWRTFTYNKKCQKFFSIVIIERLHRKCKVLLKYFKGQCHHDLKCNEGVCIMKLNAKKLERRFDRSTVIFKLGV